VFRVQGLGAQGAGGQGFCLIREGMWVKGHELGVRGEGVLEDRSASKPVLAENASGPSARASSVSICDSK